tara:strand:- start:59 stop:625 length:567 start_codon:yes stop_codon:yes gene_type:complete
MTGPIIVTGCQRSGTTIATQMIAHDLNYFVIDEFGFLPNDLGIHKINVLINQGIENIVIQCPSALLMYVDLFHGIPDVHFIGMVRDTEDIVSSMKRVRWRMNDFYHWPDYMYDHIEHMNYLWNSLKKIIPDDCWTEVTYDSLMGHPLYVPKEKRINFTVKQWELDKPCGMPFWDVNLDCLARKMSTSE